MIYINEETLEYPVFEQDIRNLYKETVSFPVIFEPVGPFKKVEPTLSSYDPDTERVIEGKPAFDVKDGKWKQVWVNEPLGKEEIASRLANQLSTKKAELKSTILLACQRAIVGGFTSDALGSTHTYGSDMTDQQNLSANVMSSLMPDVTAEWYTPQLCADSEGVWDYRIHSATQIQQVGKDGKAAIMTYLVKKAQLFSAIESAVLLSQLDEIAW